MPEWQFCPFCGSHLTKTDMEFCVEGVPFKMIFVEGGTFQMGATPEQGDDANPDEKTVHDVTLDSFYLAETEVTQALWRAVTGKEPSTEKSWSDMHGKGDDYPVYLVTWEDCQQFIKKLNALTGRRFRLPTEAEWEYAARGGNKSRNYKYSGSNDIEEVGWYLDNSDDSSHPVKSKKANELGLYDMSGNVSEMCSDWYIDDYSDAPQCNPKGPASGRFHVRRGGGWFGDRQGTRVSDRGHVPPFALLDMGLRLALSEHEEANDGKAAETPQVLEADRQVSVGDILCSDGTIVPNAFWPVEGKIALGIVFSVDETHKHGWAVNIKESGRFAWMPEGKYAEVSGLQNCEIEEDALNDMDGYSNTERIREAGDASLYPAAYAVDFAEGWYFPSCGQWKILLEQSAVLDHALQIVGGDRFEEGYGAAWFWSSTQNGEAAAWLVTFKGFVKCMPKYGLARVRCIRNF